MKAVWISDVHLDHCSEAVIEAFYQTIRDAAPTHIFITGDTGTSYNIRKYLKELAELVPGAKTFGVLGNHCVWGSSIEKVQKIVHGLQKTAHNFLYLSTSGPILLDDTTAIVGHDGWYDARHGDPQPRRFVMHDWQAISEYSQNTSFYYPTFEQDVIRISQELALKAVLHVQKQLTFTYEHGVKNIIVLTHIPPWAEVAHHRGRPNDAIAAPWYTSKVMGAMLTFEATSHPEVDFTVLCGHTHGPADYHPADNLHCHAGGAEYGAPRIQRDVFAQKPVDQESAAE